MAVNTWFVENTLRPLFRAFSSVPAVAYYDSALFKPTAALEAAYPEIRAELDKLLPRLGDMPPFHLISPDQTYISSDDKWKMFFLKAGNLRFERNCQEFPETMRILDQFPEIISAYFSFIGPNKMLYPHRGPWSGVLRMHLGLVIPTTGKGCTLVCNKIPYRWREGEVVVFDDTYEHFAVNLSDSVRVVLFLDILRPLPYFLDKLNRAIVWCARFTPYFQEPIRRHKEWEREFYKED